MLSVHYNGVLWALVSGGEQGKNTEKGMMSGNSKEMYNTLSALTKTQQHKSAVIEGSSENILTESTAVLNW